MSNPEFAHVRHDLRGCLNAIQLSVEVLKTLAPDESAREFLTRITSEVGRADRLLQTTAVDDRSLH